MSDLAHFIRDDMSKGLTLRTAGVGSADAERLLNSRDDWEILAGVLLSCQEGRFDQLSRIPVLLRHNDGFSFWKAAMELLGYAGNWSSVASFVQEYRDRWGDAGVQYFLAIVMANCSGLWVVEPMLTLHSMAEDQESRYQIERHLSYLLEKDNDGVWFGAQEEQVIVDSENLEVRTQVDYAGYAREVRAACGEVVATVRGESVPIYEGQVVDVLRTARVLHERLISGEDAVGRIFREALMLEAAAGVDCSGFFSSDRVLRHLEAIATVEEFLESDPGGRFKPGQRYFFGRPVPT